MNGWSTTSWVVAAALALVVVLAVLVLVLLLGNRRTRAELAATRATQAELLVRVEALALAPAAAPPRVETAEFVITEVGTHRGSAHPGVPDAAVPGRIEGRLFVDIVARETLVKAASWTHGVARALSPENRNRLRFEVRRETKRATRRHKADVKEALRQYYARQQDDGAQGDVA